MPAIYAHSTPTTNGRLPDMIPSADRFVSEPRARHTLSMLLLATVLCGIMLGIRCGIAQNSRFAFLAWNLFLAWVPMVLSLVIVRLPKTSPRLWLWGIAVAWLLFFPNTFYIMTDLVHYKKFGTDQIERWFDVAMITSFTTLGMFLGISSLYIMHLLVRSRMGWRAGWCFAVGVLALGAFGIYLGRAFRLNSWDIIQPWKMLGKLAEIAEPGRPLEVLAFSVTFFILSLTIYGFFASAVRIHEKSDDLMEQPGEKPSPGDAVPAVSEGKTGQS